MKPVSFMPLLAASCLLAVPALPGDEAPDAEPPAKHVIAIQAFLPDGEAQRIADLCLSLQGAALEGYRCAFQHGAEPHFTVGAWRVTDDEAANAAKRLAGADLNSVAARRIAVRLEERSDEEVAGYFFVPVDPDAFRPFHRATHQALAYPYQALSASRNETADWWPHLTLFTVRQSDLKHEQVVRVMAALRSIESVEVHALALVEFDGGIRTVGRRMLPDSQPRKR